MLPHLWAQWGQDQRTEPSKAYVYPLHRSHQTHFPTRATLLCFDAKPPDWCAFGHKFSQRCGHGTAEHQSERSPIFVQFLDVCSQLIDQFPSAFEFTPSLLLFLADAVHSCLYGQLAVAVVLVPVWGVRLACFWAVSSSPPCVCNAPLLPLRSSSPLRPHRDVSGGQRVRTVRGASRA